MTFPSCWWMRLSPILPDTPSSRSDLPFSFTDFPRLLESHRPSTGPGSRTPIAKSCPSLVSERHNVSIVRPQPAGPRRRYSRKGCPQLCAKQGVQETKWLLGTYMNLGTGCGNEIACNVTSA